MDENDLVTNKMYLSTHNILYSISIVYYIILFVQTNLKIK